MSVAPTVLLVYAAPSQGEAWMDFLPIGLGTLQAMLKSRGYVCRLANLSQLSRQQILTYFCQQAPTVIGVSMFTFNRGRSMDILEWARIACPQAVLLAGGPHPTHMAQDVFDACPALDAIVKGEGEIPLLTIAEQLQTGKSWQEAPGLILRDKETPTPLPLADLDSLGLPAQYFEADFFHDTAQLGYLSTSRGCPARCTFCNTPQYWGSQVRFHSPDYVLAHLRFLREKYGLTYFSFRDDTFTTRKDRTLALMTLIHQSDMHPVWNCQSRVNLIDEERLIAMKRAGCECIQFGVEHGSDRMLQSLHKGASLTQMESSLALVRKVGIHLGIYLITGIPGETWEDVEQSAHLIQRCKPHDVQLSPLAIYPGTHLFETSLKKQPQLGQQLAAREDNTVFARVDNHTRRALDHLTSVSHRTQKKAQYTLKEFAAQKKWLGFCAITNLLCGDALLAAQRPEDARKEFLEIRTKEPTNPWGFLKLAELDMLLGHFTEAKAHLKEVERLAPGNPQAKHLRENLSYSSRGIPK